MNNLPTMRTQEDVTREQMDKLKDGTDRELMLVLLQNMTGSATRGLPTTDDHDKIARDAVQDFQRNDFSEARRAVESLELIVDFYKDLAESYLDELTRQGNRMDEYGNQQNNIFALMDGGEQKLGFSEVLNVEEHDLEHIWQGYVKDYLPFAGGFEKDYIAEKFAAFIEEESND